MPRLHRTCIVIRSSPRIHTPRDRFVKRMLDLPMIIAQSRLDHREFGFLARIMRSRRCPSSYGDLSSRRSCWPRTSWWASRGQVPRNPPTRRPAPRCPAGPAHAGDPAAGCAGIDPARRPGVHPHPFRRGNAKTIPLSRQWPLGTFLDEDGPSPRPDGSQPSQLGLGGARQRQRRIVLERSWPGSDRPSTDRPVRRRRQRSLRRLDQCLGRPGDRIHMLERRRVAVRPSTIDSGS